MAQDFAKKFYKSKLWKDCRQAYISSVHGLCERCSNRGKVKPGFILHHKVLLTANNINNPEITLNHELLEFVCLECHNSLHGNTDDYIRHGLMFDENGDVVQC
jgi:hypothetical protein